jgi:hypothetical protein
MSKGITEEVGALLLGAFSAEEKKALPEPLRPEVRGVIDYIVRHATG